MTSTVPAATNASPPGVLDEIEGRVLWLSSSIVHHANRVRPNPSGLKVGGHQASCASMVSIMTSLWFRHLRTDDMLEALIKAPVDCPFQYEIGSDCGDLSNASLIVLFFLSCPVELKPSFNRAI